MAAVVDNSKFDELCRLCAAKTTMILAINIFENEGAIRQISKKIDSCLPVQVHEQDELPKMICENCLYKLELLCDFRERSARTERLLVEIYKQLKTELEVQNQQQQQQQQQQQENNLVSTMEHVGLIMVQHHQLLNNNLQNVAEIDLSHLSQRTEDMIVKNEIILNHHHNVDMNSHSLDSIELNNHDLTAQQELSNQSLQTQDSLMVDSSTHNSVPDDRFTEENLTIMQHQLLTDQYQIQHELHQVSMASEEDGVNSFRLPNEMKSYVPEKSDYDNSHSMDFTTAKLEESSLSVESDSISHLNDLKMQIYAHDSNHIDSIRHDDSNSGNAVSLVQPEENLHGVNAVIDKEGYILEHEPAQENHDHLLLSQVYYCNICGKSFEEKIGFETHYESHFFKCEICQVMLTSNSLLVVHRKEAHGSSMEEKTEETIQEVIDEQLTHKQELDIVDNELEERECSFQNENFYTKGDCFDDDDDDDEIIDDPVPPTQKEEVQKDDKKKKRCKDCGKTYKSNYKLQEHMRKHTGEKPYKCVSCEKAFRSKIGLAQHAAKHTGKYDYACPTCGKGFQCKSYLMVHQRVHSDVKPYPCTTCGQNFKTKQSLLDHTNRHLGVKPYICEICQRGFITKGLCRAHQKIHLGVDNRKFSCKICEKRFVSKSYLQTHLKIHTGEKTFICEVCGKGFLTRVDLKIHSTMHTGIKSYVCEMCGKAFARRDALRCHSRSHTGERPYSCNLCGQTFTQFTPMAIHKRLHTGERPYACETCGKTFVSRSTMMSHAKKHDKPKTDAKSDQT